MAHSVAFSVARGWLIYSHIWWALRLGNEWLTAILLLRRLEHLLVFAELCQGLLDCLFKLPFCRVESMFLSLHIRLLPANGFLKRAHGRHESLNHGTNILSVILQTFVLLTQLWINFLLNQRILCLVLSCIKIGGTNWSWKCSLTTLWVFFCL